MLANIVKICFEETAVQENNGKNTGFTYQYEIYGFGPFPFVHFATLCMPGSPAYPQQLCAETIPEWWGPYWTALKWHHFSNQQHVAPKTSCSNWESVRGTSTCLYSRAVYPNGSILSVPGLVSFLQPLLADQPVNDGPHSGSEPWWDACLCDGCGVLSETKGAWQAAALRLDQTGLVYWSSPLCFALFRSRVWLQRKVSERSAHHRSEMRTTRTTHRVALTTTKEKKKG